MIKRLGVLLKDERENNPESGIICRVYRLSYPKDPHLGQVRPVDVLENFTLLGIITVQKNGKMKIPHPASTVLDENHFKRHVSVIENITREYHLDPVTLKGDIDKNSEDIRVVIVPNLEEINRLHESTQKAEVKAREKLDDYTHAKQGLYDLSKQIGDMKHDFGENIFKYYTVRSFKIRKEMQVIDFEKQIENEFQELDKHILQINHRLKNYNAYYEILTELAGHHYEQNVQELEGNLNE